MSLHGILYNLGMRPPLRLERFKHYSNRDSFITVELIGWQALSEISAGKPICD